MRTHLGTQFGTVSCIALDCAVRAFRRLFLASGALAIKDGLDTTSLRMLRMAQSGVCAWEGIGKLGIVQSMPAWPLRVDWTPEWMEIREYVGWNPEGSDMGNFRNLGMGTLSMPMRLYLGRKITPDSGGPGKYRGGCGFTSTWLIHNTTELTLCTSEHSGRVYDNGGLCGGYPAPTAQVHRAVRDTNFDDLVADRKPLPHSLGLNPKQTDLETLVDGEHEWVEGPYISRPLKEGDIFAHSYNGGGGYGDPLEREPASVARDVTNGFTSRVIARNVFGVALTNQEDERTFTVDERKTAEQRAQIRTERQQKAVPARQWIDEQRKRVLDRDFVQVVHKMYAGGFRMSPTFAEEFRSFWNLPADFEFEQ